MSNNHNVKPGVSIYSYMQEWRSGQFTLEDCFAAAADTGVKGVELVLPCHFPDFPNTPTTQVKKIKQMAEKYGMQIVSSGAYTDTALKTGQKLTAQELLDQTLRDLRFSHELEAPVMRVGPNSPADTAILPAIPAAEKYGVKMGVEVHPPYTALNPAEGMTLERVKEINSPYYGLIPDFGSFADQIPTRIINFVIATFGIPPTIMQTLVDSMDAGASLGWLKQMTAAMGAPPEMDQLIELLYHLVVRDGPDKLAELKGLIIHVHGKFWDIDENGDEPSVSYPDLLSTLIDIGFDGYVVSEYEGWAFDYGDPKGVSMVEKHQALMQRTLGK